MTIKFVTNNERKYEELKAITGLDLELVKMDLEEIQGDVEAIIRHKIKQAREVIPEGPIMVEDTGLFIDSLGKLPGEYTKDFLKKIGTQGIYEMIGNKPNKATARSTIGLSEKDDSVYIFWGAVDGFVVEPQGSDKFGFDDIFTLQEVWGTTTFAEMPRKKKNECSHRHDSGMKMKEYFDRKKEINDVLSPVQFNGVPFHDITNLLSNNKLFNCVIDCMHDLVDSILYENKVSKDNVILAGMDARGFIFASAICTYFEIPMTMVRKANKLPNSEGTEVEYEKEYGKDKLCVSKIMSGKNIILIDDIAVTGNSLKAAKESFEKIGAKVLGSVVLLKKTDDKSILSVIHN